MTYETIEIKDYYSTTFKRNITLGVYWDYDQTEIEGSFDFGNDKENKEYLAKFESGELLSVVIKVTASYQSISESDYLGGCHVRAKNLHEDVLTMVKEHDMQDAASNQLYDYCKQLKDTLNHIFK